MYDDSMIELRADGVSDTVGPIVIGVVVPLDAPTIQGDNAKDVQPGDTATFNFSQDLQPNAGSLAWIVWSTIPPTSTATWASNPTSAPHSNTLSIATGKTTPPGTYAVGVEVQSSLMCESSPLTTTVLVNVIGTPPPAPTAAKSTVSAELGKDATYQLADAATSNDGTLTWNVTINQNEQPTYKLQNTATSSAPHTNSLTFNTTPDTKPGAYSISVTVTSGTTGLTSAPLNLTLDAIYSFSYTAGPSSHIVTIDGVQATPTFQGPYTFDNLFSDELTNLDDGKSNVPNVDSPTMASVSAQITRASAQSARRMIQQTGAGPEVYPCHEQIIEYNGQDGGFTVENPTAQCDGPVVVSALKIEVKKTNTAGTSVSSVYTQIANCPAPLGPTCTVTGMFQIPITKGGGYYTAAVLPIVLAGKASLSGQGDRTTETFFYNNANAIYRTVMPYGLGQPLEIPQPPLINCRGISGITQSGPGCPKYDSDRLRRILYNAYKSTDPSLIPPGLTPSKGNGYEAHHIKPGSCGGGDALENGAFLVKADHTRITTWFRKVPPCGQDT